MNLRWHIEHFSAPLPPSLNKVIVLQKGHCLPLPPRPSLIGVRTTALQDVQLFPKSVRLLQKGHFFPGIFLSSNEHHIDVR